MEIIKMYLIDNYEYLLLLSDGTYRIGSSYDGYRDISKEDAEKLINQK